MIKIKIRDSINPVKNEDEADRIEKYEFDDKGSIIDHETIEL